MVHNSTLFVQTGYHTSTARDVIHIGMRVVSKYPTTHKMEAFKCTNYLSSHAHQTFLKASFGTVGEERNWSAP